MRKLGLYQWGRCPLVPLGLLGGPGALGRPWGGPREAQGRLQGVPGSPKILGVSRERTQPTSFSPNAMSIGAPGALGRPCGDPRLYKNQFLQTYFLHLPPVSQRIKRPPSYIYIYIYIYIWSHTHPAPIKMMLAQDFWIVFMRCCTAACLKAHRILNI